MGVGIKAKVRCPKCGKGFEYTFVPGSSFTSIRVAGRWRYMKCKKCGRYAMFDVMKGMDPVMMKHLAVSQTAAGIGLLVLAYGILLVGARYSVSAPESTIALDMVAVVSAAFAALMIVAVLWYGTKK